MNKALLDIVCCPVTRQPLALLDAARLESLNAAINTGSVTNACEEALSAPLTEALVSRDGRRVYPVEEGIPVLLEDACIDWSQVAD